MFVRYNSNPTQEKSDSNPANVLTVPLPALGELHTENLPPANSIHKKQGSFDIWENGIIRFGHTRVGIEKEDVKDAARAVYGELFGLNKEAYLYRVWNYLPGLNEGQGDKERYKQFCEGRSNAFFETFGDQNQEYMPAGSCVGVDGDELVIYFLAGSKRPNHHENPNQIPAYRYPRQYGPKSPSFARATSIHLDNLEYCFISGTAAVIGHASQGKNNLQKQLEVTCKNLDQISAQIRKPGRGFKGAGSSQTGKVYLRHSTDYQETRNFLESRFPHLANSLIYLRSDICRKELLVEIELFLIDEDDLSQAS